jgi:hypothetical protein
MIQKTEKTPYPGIEDDLEDETDYSSNPYVEEAFDFVKKNINHKLKDRILR